MMEIFYSEAKNKQYRYLEKQRNNDVLGKSIIRLYTKNQSSFELVRPEQ